MEVPQGDSSPWGDVSTLSKPSSHPGTPGTSKLTTNDIGLPVTPEGRVVKPIDEAAIDEGYDSEGLPAPWEGIGEEIFDGPEEVEAPLPIGQDTVPPAEAIAKNVAQKILPLRSCSK